MKSLLIFLSIVLYSCFHRIEAEEVVTLTTSTFKKTIEENPFVLVEFYAPWCGHCKKLAPEYEKAALAIKGFDPKVIVAKVDATAETELATEFEIQGFPTLKWFANGKVSEYNGGRTEKTIVSWVQKKTGPAAIVLKSVEDLLSFKTKADAVVVGFFKDEVEARGMLSHAQTDDDTPYAICYTACEPLKQSAGVSAESKLVVLQTFDAGKAEFTGDISKTSDIASFVSANSLPLVIPFSQKNAPKIFNGDIKSQLIVFLDSHDSEAGKKITESVKPVAEKNKGKLMLVTVQKSDSRILEFFGVSEKEIPTARIVKMASGGALKYKFTDTLNVENLEKFAESYFEGKLSLDLKSEEIVPESAQGNVRVIVGKDFEQVVNQPGKHVLVEFYAPWCGHCKKLEPEYTALGEYFKDNDNIIIAKMDATANEVERVQISGFPTLKFFPADSSEIVDYDGERTKAGLIKFLEKYTKTS